MPRGNELLAIRFRESKGKVREGGAPAFPVFVAHLLLHQSDTGNYSRALRRQIEAFFVPGIQ